MWHCSAFSWQQASSLHCCFVRRWERIRMMELPRRRRLAALFQGSGSGLFAATLERFELLPMVGSVVAQYTYDHCLSSTSSKFSPFSLYCLYVMYVLLLEQTLCRVLCLRPEIDTEKRLAVRTNSLVVRIIVEDTINNNIMD